MAAILLSRTGVQIRGCACRAGGPPWRAAAIAAAVHVPWPDEVTRAGAVGDAYCAGAVSSREGLHVPLDGWLSWPSREALTRRVCSPGACGPAPSRC